MRINIMLSTCILIIAIALSCSPSLKVTSNYDRTVDFSAYKTFALDTLHASQSLSQVNKKRISDAVRATMIQKGFTESTSPDLLIHIAAVFKKQKSVSATADYYGYGGVYKPYASSGGLGATDYTTYSVQHYVDGSLILDIADAKTRKLLWQGIGNKEIDKPSKDPDTVVADAINKIMAGFPPGAASKK